MTCLMLQLANSPRATDDMTAAMIFRGWGGGGGRLEWSVSVHKQTEI